MIKVGVIGCGYVGLIQAAGLASVGNTVYASDVDPKKLELLKQGVAPFFEPGLDELLKSSRKHIQFFNSATPEYLKRLKECKIIFLAVGTPQKEDGSSDLSYLINCVELISYIPGDLKDFIIATKSTVPVTTGELLEQLFAKNGKFPLVVSNPEFLKQGAAVSDFLKPERVVVGSNIIYDDLKKLFLSLYGPFVQRNNRILFMDRNSAELVKYASNAFLATKISFINEISRLSEAFKANIHSVRKGMTMDSRIGDQFLFPGIGYGGSCFPKDTRSLIMQGQGKMVDLKICKSVDAVNEDQKLWFYRKLKEIGFKQKLDTVTFWGLSFKPNTDDIREAPSIYNIDRLLNEFKCQINVYDPQAMENIRQHFFRHKEFKRIRFFDDAYGALLDSDALLLCTEWPEFKSADLLKMRSLLSTPLLLDGRLIYDKIDLESMGFEYHGVGL